MTLSAHLDVYNVALSCRRFSALIASAYLLPTKRTRRPPKMNSFIHSFVQRIYMAPLQDDYTESANPEKKIASNVLMPQHQLFLHHSTCLTVCLSIAVCLKPSLSICLSAFISEL